MPPTPTLKLRKDIWAHFPVITDDMGRGANGADRHCIKWHNMNARKLARERGMTEQELKATLLPQLLRALSASSSWTVQAPPPGSDCIAVIAMRFGDAPRKNNATRRVSPKVKANAKPKSKSPNTRKHKRSASPKAKSKSPATRKVAAKDYSDLKGDAMFKKAQGILNLMSAATVDRLSHDFATLKPAGVSEFEQLMKIVAETAMDQQAYHPLLIHLLHVLDAQHTAYPEKPSAAVATRILQRAMEEPVFAKMEVTAEESNAPNNNLDTKVALQKRFFRSVMLFSGFLYRDGFVGWSEYKPLLRHFAAMALETDPADLDYRVFDGYAQGLMYTLIRAGARMLAEGGEAAATFQRLLLGIGELAKTAKRGFVRTDALELLASVEAGFKIKPGMTWTIGAPLSDVKVNKVKSRSPARAPMAFTRRSPKPRSRSRSPKAVMPKAEGLGADIAELWRRFPLDVKQEAGMYVVRFHNKKLRERFEKEPAGKYRTVGDLEATLARHILGLVDNSVHWRRGPAVPGAFVTIVKK